MTTLDIFTNIIGGIAFFALLLIAMITCQSMNPVRVLAILATRTIALCYLLEEMWQGAWARRDRWKECVERVNREI